MLADTLRERGVQVWPQDGRVKVKTAEPLTEDQRAYLRRHREALFEELTEPSGTRYRWRRLDPHNAAGWHILYSTLDLEGVVAMLGGDVEVRTVETTT